MISKTKVWPTFILMTLLVIGEGTWAASGTKIDEAVKSLEVDVKDILLKTDSNSKDIVRLQAIDKQIDDINNRINDIDIPYK